MLATPETLSVDVAGAQALRARASAGDKGALRAAAKQFESLMIGMMLKSMRETKFSEDDDPMSSGEGVKLYSDLLDQQWASQLSKGRGLGFADMIVKSMDKYATTPGAGQAGGQAAAVAKPDAAVPLRPVTAPRGISLKPVFPVPLLPVTTPAATPVAPAAATPVAKGPKRAFLESLRPQAEAAAAATGVPADFILAHAALESGWGAHEITGADGQLSHNLFGIKAGSNWQGAAVETQTTEYRQGMPLKVAQRFRAYSDYGAAFSDYASLLKVRYGAAVGGDAGHFADSLASAGYATDPAYAGKLKSIIASVAMASG